jgi:hypothetical protein
MGLFLDTGLAPTSRARALPRPSGKASSVSSAWWHWESKRWPELPVARKRVVLTALIERIEVSVDRIDIRFRPSRLSALLDAAATPLQGATDDETEILSVPVRLRRAGREIRMVIDGTDPFAAKPDGHFARINRHVASGGNR